MDNHAKYFTLEQAADALGISRARAYELVRRGVARWALTSGLKQLDRAGHRD